MLFQRLAHTPFLCLILLWTTLLAAANAATVISSEILNFVPACAQSCFESYIINNFNLDQCSDSSGLQCLCRQTGLTGHTVGEGAVACIVAESSRGSCVGADAGGAATSTAYNMCVGISGAAPMTHSTIVATLVVPTGTGPLSVPTASRTGTENPAQDVTSTAGPTPTSPIGSTSPVTTTPGGATSPVVSDDSGSNQTKLSSAQIAGISLGCLAVIVLGVLLVLLARYLRRKRFGDMEEGGFTKMRDSISFGKKSQQGSPPQLQISKPLQDVPFQWHMNQMEALPAQQTAAIGLALSPYRTQQAAGEVAANRAAKRGVPAVLQTPPSRSVTPKLENHQPKPSLSLAIPQPPKPAFSAPTGARDSIVTEFAEDGEDRASGSAAGNIWRPPPTDPQSATTYFAADKGGNWVLRNKPAPSRVPQISEPAVVATEVELPSPTDQTKAERAQRFSGWFSPGAVVPPLRVPSRTEPKLGSPIAFKNKERQQQQQQLRPPAQNRENRSSSVYSPYSAPLTVTPGSGNPLPSNAPRPDDYLPLVKDGRDLTGPKSRRRSMKRPARRGSEGSSTSIESGAAPPFEDEDIIEDEVQVDLSPVVESPVSPGKSPVRYPRIRRPASGQQGGSDMGRDPNMFPMPPRQTSPRPLGPPGSTPGILVPGQKKAFNPLLGLPSNPSPNRPGQMRSVSPGLPSNPSPHRQLDQMSRTASPGLPANPAANRNGGSRAASPETRPRVTPTIEQQLQRQQHDPARYWGTQPQAEERSRTVSPRPPFELPAEGFEVSEQPQWRPSQAAQQPRRPSPQVMQPAQQPRRPSPPEDPSRRTPAQTDDPEPEQQQRRPTPNQQQAWRPSPQPLQPASQGVSSQAAQGTLLAKRRGADKAAALALGNGKKPGGKGWQRESLGPAPITPGIRMMTPTRKGDDLFLDVRR
ncbi:hypothetical protein QBC47DRAFT_224037 [Echria macrotheca]|uniref:Extracellular membrane protein CFEM domain-containing protein n=1 Tax=Echria macrotheca TaxID=438768 RepID=A0AAJ0F5M6_9PEZI|nr:hypothetical protein QBC47DRAFT_224037 [Echria macrotheca]